MRDKKTEKWNSYKVMPNQYSKIHSVQSKQTNPNIFLEKEIIITEPKKPELLEKQDEMLRENLPMSPFMKTRPVDAIPVDYNYDPKVRPAPKEIINEETLSATGKDMPKEINDNPDDFHTLPLEAYDPFLGIENGEELLEIYRKANGRVLGRSRWFYPDGTSEFRDCEILSYDTEEHRYVIKWGANAIIKKASRFNIRIEGEDVNILHYRINAAINFREIAERIIQCNLLIDNIDIPVPSLPSLRKQKIAHLICNVPIYEREYRDVWAYLNALPEERAIRPRYKFTLDFKTIEVEIKIIESKKMNKKCLLCLFSEVDDGYKRAFKVMEFESKLPYNGIK